MPQDIEESNVAEEDEALFPALGTPSFASSILPPRRPGPPLSPGAVNAETLREREMQRQQSNAEQPATRIESNHSHSSRRGAATERRRERAAR